jgi:hypothetical protein
LKEKLHGLWFQSAEEITTATEEVIWDLPANIFQLLYQCWQTCIVANSDYFEGGRGYV